MPMSPSSQVVTRPDLAQVLPKPTELRPRPHALTLLPLSGRTTLYPPGEEGLIVQNTEKSPRPRPHLPAPGPDLGCSTGERPNH